MIYQPQSAPKGRNSSSGAGITSLPLAPGVPHTRERPSFANHQINKKVSNFIADYSRPGNSKIGFTANSAGNPGGQVRKQRAEGVGESMAVNKNQYFTRYQENKVCNSGSKQLASHSAERT